jgi:hypothetical protein
MGKILKETFKSIKTSLKSSSGWLEEKINDALANIFHDEKLKDIAKETNFVQRSSSRIKGNEFVQALVMASVDPESTPLSGISDNLRVINSEAEMTVSALRQRINTPEAQEFLKEVYTYTIESKLKPLSAELNATHDKFNRGALQYFSKVLIHDSSSCTLNELLEMEFKGCGGAASKSLVKIDLIYDLKKNSAEEVILTDVREPDQVLSKRILTHITKDTLNIQDLGYFEIESFCGVEDREGYYLSRLLNGVLVYLNKEDDKPIELGKHLQMLLEKGEPLDIEVFITKKKMKTRLVAYPVPEEIFIKRRREYNKASKRKTASAELIARQHFTILITNVSKEIWTWEVIGTVYKIRWQIELIFKVWKSQLSVHYLKGTKPERIRCLIYARMLAVSLIFVMHCAAASLLWSFGLEVSLPKFVNWLKRNGRFASIVIKGFTSDLWDLLITGLDLLCKDWQRKKKTAQQQIQEEVAFLETFKKCA